MSKYITQYTTSNGQPFSTPEEHADLASALGAWRANISALLLRSGGRSDLFDEDSFDRSISWHETSEGGYFSVEGDDFAEIFWNEEGRIDPDRAVTLLLNFE